MQNIFILKIAEVLWNDEFSIYIESYESKDLITALHYVRQ